MAIITVVGAGMMGSAIAFPAAQGGNTVRPVGTLLGEGKTFDEAMALLKA